MHKQELCPHLRCPSLASYEVGLGSRSACSVVQGQPEPQSESLSQEGSGSDSTIARYGVQCLESQLLGS